MSARTLLVKAHVLLILFSYMSEKCHAQEAATSHEKLLKISESIVQTALNDTAGYHLLRRLSRIGPRLSGSKNAAEAVRWAEAAMKDLGLKAWLQEVTVPRWERGKIEKAKIVRSKAGKGRALCIASLGRSIGTPNGGITAGVIEVRSFEELAEKKEQARGKIVFFNRPMDPATIRTFSAYGSAVNQRVDGAVEAAKAGGVAAIVRSVTTKYDNVPHVGVMRYQQGVRRIPSAAIGLKDADFLSECLRHDPDLRLRLTMSCRNRDPVPSYNVIGDLTGTEKPDELIVVGGHFDSWDKGDGSHDDGAGCIQALEVLNLFQRLGIRPKRTLRAVFFMDEEMTQSGARAYGAYSASCEERHVAAIEADRCAYTPRGFYVDSDDVILEKIRSWLPYLNRALIEWVEKGGSGADVGQIKNASARIGYVPDVQRCFDVHHSDNDVFAEIHPREMELGAAAMAILVYLIDQEGL